MRKPTPIDTVMRNERHDHIFRLIRADVWPPNIVKALHEGLELSDGRWIRISPAQAARDVTYILIMRTA